MKLKAKNIPCAWDIESQAWDGPAPLVALLESGTIECITYDDRAPDPNLGVVTVHAGGAFDELFFEKVRLSSLHGTVGTWRKP